MSRLYDRILVDGCSPLWAVDAYDAMAKVDAEASHRERRQAVEAQLGRPPTDAEVADLDKLTRQVLQGSVSPDVLGRQEFERAVVISAEEVADYIHALPGDTDFAEVFDRVVAPFPRMFIEFQRRPNALDLDSWGILLYGDRSLVDDGWILAGAIVGEWRKGHPIGPLAMFMQMLDADGYLRPVEDWPQQRVETSVLRGAQGKSLVVWAPNLPEFPSDWSHGLAVSCEALTHPAFLAISLMHCKNVTVRTVDPPDRLSRKHAKKDPASAYSLSRT
jgi:hypothetical protein